MSSKHEIAIIEETLSFVLKEIQVLQEIVLAYICEMHFILCQSYSEPRVAGIRPALIVSVHPSMNAAWEVAHALREWRSRWHNACSYNVRKVVPLQLYSLSYEFAHTPRESSCIAYSMNWMISEVRVAGKQQHVLATFYENMEQFLLDSRFTEEQKKDLFDLQRHWLRVKDRDSTWSAAWFQLHRLKMNQEYNCI